MSTATTHITANTHNTFDGTHQKADESIANNSCTKQSELYELRQSIAGSRYELTFTDGLLGVVVFRRLMDDGVTYLVGFSGKREKPDFNLRFRSNEHAQRHQDDWHQRLADRAKVKAQVRAERAAERSKPHGLSVGDVLVASWGYEQTNYDYYQVLRLVGKQSVEIRELGKHATPTGWLQGECVPAKGVFKGEPMIKRVTAQGSVKVRSFGVYASKKDALKVGGVEIFEPDEYTSYA